MESGHSCNINNLSVNIGKHISFSEQHPLHHPDPIPIPIPAIACASVIVNQE